MSRERWLRIFGPIALFVFIIAFWEYYVRAYDVPSMILPTPGQIFDSLVAGLRSGVLLRHLGVTAQQVAAGYVLGVSLGILLGAPIALSRTVEIFLYPYILGIQAMPKVALAPLMMIWVGYGMASKIVITTIVALFPVMVNVIIGLRTVDQDRINLVRSLKGDKWAEFRYVRLPSAAPFIFAGMKTAVVLSLLAAIAAEFVGAEAGLGYLMTQLMFRLDTAGVFAVLILLAAIGILLFLAADWLHRRVVFWDVAERDRLSNP
jgi:NitT/TauT family transport system permease protein